MSKFPITISVKLAEKDLLDFYTHNARRGILMKMLIAFALLTFTAQLIRIIITPDALQQGAWKWLVAIITLFFLMYYLNKSNAHKEFKRNKKLQEGHIYIINEDSIHIKGGSFNTIFQWNKLHNMTESKLCFFIWLSKQSAQIIPKREMTSDEITQISLLMKAHFRK